MANSATAAEARRQESDRKKLGMSLLLLSARLYRLQVETFESLGVPLSFQQFRILERVDRGATSLSTLAGLAKRRPSTISKSVDSLVRQGLLTREQAASDRRTITLKLTAPGAATLRQAQRALENLASWLAEDVQSDLPELQELLEHLYEKAEPRVQADADGAGRAPEW